MGGYLGEQHLNPASKIKPFRECFAERWVTPEEPPALGGSIEAEENPFIRVVLTLAIFSGMTRAAEAEVERRGFRPERDPAGAYEGRRPPTVPFVPSAAAVLRQLPRMLGNPYVFASLTSRANTWST